MLRGMLGVVGATSIASFTAMILMVICFNKKYVNVLDKGWFAKYMLIFYEKLFTHQFLYIDSCFEKRKVF